MGYNRTLGHFTNSQELATVWASGQNYIVNQLVLDNNKLYRCITAHTSGATFAGDSAYWSGLNPGATVAISEGGTGQTTKTDAFDALAPTTTAGDLIVYNGTDNVRLPVGTDGQMIVADASQTNKLKWATVPQGSKNYITYSNFENNATTGWSLFNTTLDANKIPNGSIVAGAGSLNALAVSSSTPLAGSYSLSVTSPGAVAAGQGFITDPLTIDREDQAKVLTFSFYYETVSGTMNFSGTSANTWAIYIHDGTNWIQPAGVYGMTQSSGVGLVTGTFQTNATGTSYRLAVVCITATGAAISMKFDDFKLSPQTAPIGPVVTDWVSYTPTGTWTTNTTYTGRWRRVGGNGEYEIGITLSGAPNAATLTVALPSGQTIDTARLTNVSRTLPNASGSVGDASPLNNYKITAFYNDASSVLVTVDNASSTYSILNVVNNTVPVTFASGDTLTITFSVPISGWSSNVQLSNDTDTRVVAASYYFNSIGLTNTTAIAGIWTQNYDTHAAFTNANGRFTAPVSGIYRASVVSIRSTGTGNSMTLYKNGVLYYNLLSYALAGGAISGTIQLDLKAGDYVTVGVDGSFTAQAVFNIERLSGPSVIAASESVGCFYYSNGLQANIPNAGFGAAVTVCTTKSFDTHNAFNGATGLFTAPVSGMYQVDCGFSFVPNATGTRSLYIFHGAGAENIVCETIVANATTPNQLQGSALIKLKAGEQVNMQVIQNSGGVLANDISIILGKQTYFSCVRVGN